MFSNFNVLSPYKLVAVPLFLILQFPCQFFFYKRFNRILIIFANTFFYWHFFRVLMVNRLFLSSYKCTVLWADKLLYGIFKKIIRIFHRCSNDYNTEMFYLIKVNMSNKTEKKLYIMYFGVCRVLWKRHKYRLRLKNVIAFNM